MQLQLAGWARLWPLRYTLPLDNRAPYCSFKRGREAEKKGLSWSAAHHMLEIMTEVTIISALVKLRLITTLFTEQYKYLTNSRRHIIYGLILMRKICSGGEMTLAMTMKLHVKFLHWKCEFM